MLRQQENRQKVWAATQQLPSTAISCTATLKPTAVAGSVQQAQVIRKVRCNAGFAVRVLPCKVLVNRAELLLGKHDHLLGAHQLVGPHGVPRREQATARGTPLLLVDRLNRQVEIQLGHACKKYGRQGQGNVQLILSSRCEGSRRSQAALPS